MATNIITGVPTAGFRAWLETRFSTRVAGDVCSRAKRLAEMVDLTAVQDETDLASKLIKTPAFSNLTVSVRSQLKRAGQLILEFRRSAKR